LTGRSKLSADGAGDADNAEDLQPIARLKFAEPIFPARFLAIRRPHMLSAFTTFTALSAITCRTIEIPVS
jgi:hypothetical protein